MTTYTILLRAVQNLTAEVVLDAATEEEARKFALTGPINWDVSDPWDIQIENVS